MFRHDTTVVVKTANGNYSFPKGKRKKRETDMDAALRETREETSIQAKDLKFYTDEKGRRVFVDEVKNNPSVRYFVAELKRDVDLKFDDPDELDEVMYMKIDDVLSIPEENMTVRRMTAFKTILELYKYPADAAKRKKALSKAMSWVLRHGIIEVGLDGTMTSDAYVPLDKFMELDQMKRYTVAEIEDVVKTSDKQRFSLIEREGIRMIRCNQGHREEVGLLLDDDLMLDKVTEPLDVCLHGTDKKSYEIIKTEGLKPMSRKHIHLAAGLPGENGVISGMRTSCKVIIHIDMKKALERGKRFYLSDNNVILAADTLEPDLFSKVDIL